MKFEQKTYIHNYYLIIIFIKLGVSLIADVNKVIIPLISIVNWCFKVIFKTDKLKTNIPKSVSLMY